MTTPSDFYARAVAGTPPVTTEGGASGYFSAPQSGLDPNLFDGRELRSEVKARIMALIYNEFKKLGLQRPHAWCYVWLAGSGISHQWAADRGNGDLDVMLGADYPAFLRENPDWSSMPEPQFAEWLNMNLKTDLWPRTAHEQFGNQTYEVTYYLNPGVGRDITVINPYAAYNVRNNQWVVTPGMPDPTNYPKAWFEASLRDQQSAEHLVGEHNRLHDELDRMVPGSPLWHNKGVEIRNNAERGVALFDEIHEGRHEAFRPGGHGYSDWHNFRWQQGKASGTIAGLKSLRDYAQAAHDSGDQELYGGHIASANEALQHAAIVHMGRPGLR